MSPEPPLALHEHRLDHNRSKLPSFRIADVKSPNNPMVRDHDDNTNDDNNHVHDDDNRIVHDDTISPTNISGIPQEHYAGPITTATATTSASSPSPPRPPLLPSSSFPNDSSPRLSNPDRSHARTRTRSGGPQSPPSSSTTTTTSTSSPPSALARAHKPPRNHPVPASHSRNDVLGSGPPPAMITQKVSLQALDTENSTKDWVADQSALTSPSATGESTSNSNSNKTSSAAASALSSQPTTPLIPPIRGFRTSRRSTEAASRRVSMDQDDTLKAFEGFSAQRFLARDRDEQPEQNSDDSDLFLKLAREESAATARTVNRRVRTVQSVNLKRYAPPYLGHANASSSRNRSR